MCQTLRKGGHTLSVQIDERRIVRLGGTRNLRDVGGYLTADGRRTRWRTLYRSDCLDRLDDIGQAWLIDAGLRTIIDLRDNTEIVERPNVFAESAQVAYRRLPFWDEPPPDSLEPDVSEGYVSEVNQLGERMARLFQAVVAPGALPTLIHCAAGKDRTGIAIALLLEAVGVEREAIAEDYSLSNACLGPEYVVETQKWAESRGYDWAMWAHLSDTPPERMQMTLEHIDRRFGGVKQYVMDHGFPAEGFAELRELLTEPA
jgi:protein-tyrosine phosphatase